ncbi:hypothetical protein EVAR_30004_1 [Eumeta japonica]|uniref:Uncharacterized protein n=1 Tax=Eumeta variegata TaxID=151549 RepID=A0A4C1VUG0_EUMVA|nr:hypothetical protein EVAR_30004_1 [Eumeta japonica]
MRSLFPYKSQGSLHIGILRALHGMDLMTYDFSTGPPSRSHLRRASGTRDHHNRISDRIIAITIRLMFASHQRRARRASRPCPAVTRGRDSTRDLGQPPSSFVPSLESAIASDLDAVFGLFFFSLFALGASLCARRASGLMGRAIDMRRSY